MITVKVGAGTSQVDFILHKELAARYSSFFRAATQGRWAEARTGVVDLPDDSPEISMGFQKWLYCQYFDVIEFDEHGCTIDPSNTNDSTRGEGDKGDDRDEDEAKGRFLVDSYIFGDKINALVF